MWNSIEVSYQTRHAFTSTNILQPILNSDLSLTEENVQQIDANLKHEVARLTPICNNVLKDMVMVCKREEIKRRLEELRVEMDSCKNKCKY
jgi:hypothetical protein